MILNFGNSLLIKDIEYHKAMKTVHPPIFGFPIFKNPSTNRTIYCMVRLPDEIHLLYNAKPHLA